MVDFLFDSKNDQNYKQDVLEISKPIDMYVEQIKMALESDLGSIMGADVTIDLETLVFEDNLDERSIEQNLRNIVSNFCSFYSNFSTRIEVGFTKGSQRDICLISMVVSDLVQKNETRGFKIMIT